VLPWQTNGDKNKPKLHSFGLVLSEFGCYGNSRHTVQFIKILVCISECNVADIIFSSQKL